MDDAQANVGNNHLLPYHAAKGRGLTSAIAVFAASINKAFNLHPS
jgi:hypothetical protein